MMIDFMLFGLVALLMVPAICAYYAHSRGRSFWLWFLIGTFLPIISYFILLLLPDKSNPLEEDLQELRLQNKMLGTVPDIPTEDPLSRIAQKAPVRNIEFGMETDLEGKRRLEIMVDQRPLTQLLQRMERAYAKAEGSPDLAGSYKGVPLTLALAPYKHFLGEPSRRYSCEGAPVVLVGNEKVPIHLKPQWRLSARITFYRRLVVWHDLSLEARKGQWGYFDPEVLVFNRYQYEEALKELAHCVS